MFFFIWKKNEVHPVERQNRMRSTQEHNRLIPLCQGSLSSPFLGIDWLIVELLGLIIKTFDNQTESWNPVSNDLIIKSFDTIIW
jgi:hypothetical protein